ncbi:hypothetical protein CARUB_v10018664mg [Capsella rubella]|uniref:RNase H type-1 domain-containing protein n=1 Tax=Capsella rubella TaxID=81985 RepID=R0HN42_9BRAS|nr:hypothetical protein CARUB_v10018664mg [Capsella rubella]
MICSLCYPSSIKQVYSNKAWQQAKWSQPQKRKQGAHNPAERDVHPEAIRCFSDAAWKEATLRCGMGWSIKSPGNDLLQQGSSFRTHVSSVLVAETLALKVAISAALALGATRLACFSDCQDLIRLLNSGGHANELDGLLEDIKFLCSKFISISFLFIPRSLNSEADALAKAGLVSCCSSPV